MRKFNLCRFFSETNKIKDFIFCAARCFISVFLVLAFLTVNVFSREVERSLTLEESVITAKHNSQELLAIDEQIDIAKNRISEARSQTYPKIDFNLSISQFENNAPTVLSPSFNTVYLPDLKKDVYYFTRFSLWQYLYAGGRYKTNFRLAEINLSQAQSHYEAVTNRVVFAVRKAFYSQLAAEEKRKVYESIISEKINSPAGLKGSFALRKLKMGLLIAQNELEQQKLKFLDAVGLELNTIYELKGELVPVQETYDLHKCLAWAYKYRPELRQTQFEETIDSLKVNLSLTERYPTITLGANYELVGDNFPLSNKNWNATLNLNVPIFDGWASWARIKQRKNQAREGKIGRAKIEDRVRLEVREAFMDYNFRISQINFINSIEPGNFEERLETKLLYIDTVRFALESHAALEWAVGRSLNRVP